MRDDTMAKVARCAWPANAAAGVIYYLTWMPRWYFLAWALFAAVIATLQAIAREWPLDAD